MEEKKICHVCKKEKEPYTVFLTNSVISIIKYHEAREEGEICQRCDQYYAMTGEFKDSTKEEFEIAKKASWFARMMHKWWTKDTGLVAPEGFEPEDISKNNRAWGGTEFIAKWCRAELSSPSPEITDKGLKEIKEKSDYLKKCAEDEDFREKEVQKMINSSIPNKKKKGE